MGNKNTQDFDEIGEFLFKIFFVCTVLTIVYLIYLYTNESSEFWSVLFFYVTPVYSALSLVFILHVKKVNNRKHYLTSVAQNMFEDKELHSFVNQYLLNYGKDKSKQSWEYRKNYFSDQSLQEFSEIIVKKGFKISNKNTDNVKSIIQQFIDLNESKLLRQTLEAKTINSYDDFKKDGVDFEILIARLYEAMGYTSKRIGKAGDQGGDVIAAKDGKIIAVQAKFYKGSVGNKAVQEAYAALGFYGCTSATVVTTSSFTRSAVDLARSLDVELIDGRKLRTLLLEHLQESWS
jgi:HJR/Mrr/RecB family endonuclease